MSKEPRPERGSGRRSVIGVDGCRAGWAVASAEQVLVVERLDAFVADATITTIGVDMPIGLPESWGRSADRAARRFLAGRASTVFPTPPRSLLGATTFEEANALSRREHGQGLPRQTFNLFPKMRQLDAVMRPDQVERIIEIHPECSFAAMAGRPLPPKRTAEGRQLRGELLEVRYGAIVHHRPPGARVDDVLDAFAVLWSAQRFARRGHIVHGPVELDPRGLPMRIVT